MTKKEVYNYLLTNLVPMEKDEAMKAELSQVLTNALAQLDHRAEKAKEYNAKKKAENDALVDAIGDVLTNEFATIEQIVLATKNPDLTKSKASPRLKKLVEDGIAEKGEITIDGEGRKRKLVAYKKK